MASPFAHLYAAGTDPRTPNTQRKLSPVGAALLKQSGPSSDPRIQEAEKSAGYTSANGEEEVLTPRRKTHFKMPDGSLKPIIAPSGERYLIHNSGQRHPLDPVTKEPVILNEKGEAKSIYDSAPTFNMNGKVYARVPGYPDKEIGIDPNFNPNAATPEQEKANAAKQKEDEKARRAAEDHNLAILQAEVSQQEADGEIKSLETSAAEKKAKLAEAEITDKRAFAKEVLMKAERDAEDRKIGSAEALEKAQEEYAAARKSEEQAKAATRAIEARQTQEDLDFAKLKAANDKKVDTLRLQHTGRRQSLAMPTPAKTKEPTASETAPTTTPVSALPTGKGMDKAIAASKAPDIRYTSDEPIAHPMMVNGKLEKPLRLNPSDKALTEDTQAPTDYPRSSLDGMTYKFDPKTGNATQAPRGPVMTPDVVGGAPETDADGFTHRSVDLTDPRNSPWSASRSLIIKADENFGDEPIEPGTDLTQETEFGAPDARGQRMGTSIESRPSKARAKMQNVPLEWTSNSALTAQANARDTGTDVIHTNADISVEMPESKLDAEGALKVNGKQVGIVRRTMLGLPEVELAPASFGQTASPSYRSSDPFKGAPEYAAPSAGFREQQAKAGNSFNADKPWREQRWGDKQVAEFIENWNGFGDAERRKLMDSDLLKDMEGEMPNARDLFMAGRVSLQQARQIDQAVYGRSQKLPDYTESFTAWKGGESPAAAKLRTLEAAGFTGASTRELELAKQRVLTEWEGEYRKRHGTQPDFDPNALVSARKFIAGTESTGWQTFVSDAEDLGSSVGGSLAGIAHVMGKQGIKMATGTLGRTLATMSAPMIPQEQQQSIRDKQAKGEPMSDDEKKLLFRMNYTDGKNVSDEALAMIEFPKEMELAFKKLGSDIKALGSKWKENDENPAWKPVIPQGARVAGGGMSMGGGFASQSDKDAAIKAYLEKRDKGEGNVLADIDLLKEHIDNNTLTPDVLKTLSDRIKAKGMKNVGMIDKSNDDQITQKGQMEADKANRYDLTQHSNAAALMAGYNETRDESYIEMLKDLMYSTAEREELIMEAGRHASMEGLIQHSDSWGAFNLTRRGIQTDIKEGAIEAAGWGIGFGIGKALNPATRIFKAAGKAGTAATKMQQTLAAVDRGLFMLQKSKTLAAMKEMGEAYGKAGLRANSPILNRMIQTGKEIPLQMIDEGVQGFSAAMFEEGKSGNEVTHATVLEAMGGFIATAQNMPLVAGAGAIERMRMNAANQKHSKAWADDWNRKHPEQPITPGDAMGIHSIIDQRDLAASRAAAFTAIEGISKYVDEVGGPPSNEVLMPLIKATMDIHAIEQVGVQTYQELEGIGDKRMKAFVKAGLRTLTGQPLTTEDQKALGAVNAAGEPLITMVKGQVVFTEAGLAEVSQAADGIRGRYFPPSQEAQEQAINAEAELAATPPPLPVEPAPAEAEQSPTQSPWERLSSLQDGVKTPAEWAKEAGFQILSADGWRGKDSKDFDEPISKDEFLKRFNASTVKPLQQSPAASPAEPTLATSDQLTSGDVGTSVDKAAHDAASSPTNNKRPPTPAEIEAGNYAKGHPTIGGIKISIENPAGSTRRSKPGAPKPWATPMVKAHYGYMRGTVGEDGDQIDVFVKKGTSEDFDGMAFVIPQRKPDGSFDEHKVMIGYASIEEAKAAYKAHYPKGWQGYRPAMPVPMSELASMVKSGKLKKPNQRQRNEANNQSDQVRPTGLQQPSGVQQDPEGQNAPTQAPRADQVGQRQRTNANEQPSTQPTGPVGPTPSTDAAGGVPAPTPGVGETNDATGSSDSAITPDTGAEVGEGSAPSVEKPEAVWSIRTNKGRKLTIPASAASTTLEARAIFSKMLAAEKRPLFGAREMLVLGNGSEVAPLAEATIEQQVFDIVSGLVSKTPARDKQLVMHLGRLVIAGIHKHAKMLGVAFSDIEITDRAMEGGGMEVLGNTLIISPTTLIRSMRSFPPKYIETFVDAGFFHEALHPIIGKFVSSEKAAYFWNALTQEAQDAFKMSYEQGNEGSIIKGENADVQWGYEYLRALIEKKYNARTSEELFVHAGVRAEIVAAIKKVVAFLLDIQKSLKEGVDHDLIKEITDSAEQAIIESGIATGNVDAQRNQSFSKAKAEPIGNSARARAMINEEFGAMAKSLGIDIIPNYAGPSAHYVISEDGKRRGGYIEINPVKVANWSRGQMMEAMREEMIHAIEDRALVAEMQKAGYKMSDPYIQSGDYHVDFFKGVYDMMSPEQIAYVKDIYSSHGNREYVIGSEFRRMLLQNEHYKGLTEAAMAGGKNSAKAKKAIAAIAALLKTAVKYLRALATTNTPAGKQAARIYEESRKMLQKLDPRGEAQVLAMAAPQQPNGKAAGWNNGIPIKPQVSNQMPVKDVRKMPSAPKQRLSMAAPAARDEIKKEFADAKAEAEEDGSNFDEDRFIRDVSAGNLEELFPKIYSEHFGDPESYNGTVFHKTKKDEAESIAKDGVMPQKKTRGLDNRGTGPAIFTSVEDDPMNSYGDYTVEINLREARKLNKDITTGLEEPVEVAIRRSALANLLGVEEDGQFGTDSSSGEADTTLVIYGHVDKQAIRVTSPDGSVMHVGDAFDKQRMAGPSSDLRTKGVGAIMERDRLASEIIKDGSYRGMVLGFASIPFGDAQSLGYLIDSKRGTPFTRDQITAAQREANAIRSALPEQPKIASRPLVNPLAKSEMSDGEVEVFAKALVANRSAPDKLTKLGQADLGRLLKHIAKTDTVKISDLQKVVTGNRTNAPAETKAKKIFRRIRGLVSDIESPSTTPIMEDGVIRTPVDKQTAIATGYRQSMASPSYDREYFKLVEDGNTDGLRNLLDEIAKEKGFAFKGWHGSKEKGFNEFKEGFVNANESAFGKLVNEKMWSFSSSEEQAKSYAEDDGETRQFYIKLEKPYEHDYRGAGIWWKTQIGIERAAQAGEYDGVILHRVVDTRDQSAEVTLKTNPATTYKVKSPNQIKSAELIVRDENGEIIPPSERFSDSASILRMAGPLIGLPSKVKIPGMGEREFGPYQPARDTAASYMKQAGMSYDPPRTYAKVNKERAERIAAAFDAMKHEPQDPNVAAAYKALIAETVAQWEAIKKTGLKVSPMKKGMADPYAASPRLAQVDVEENNHLWFYPTDFGFGNDVTGFDPKDNPLFEFTGEVIDGHKMRANDVFRIVHDYFGHFKEGVGFRADGEENAWRQHAAMFSDLARGALTTETRGQNSWLNFGPYGEKNRTAKVEDTVFADQKIGLMPEWTWKEGLADPVSGGAAFAKFFNETQTTKDGGATFKDAKEILQRPLEGHEAELQSYIKFGSNFQKHIMASIPGFLDARIRVMRGMAEAAVALGRGGKEVAMLDITSSEGYFTKAWAEQAQARGVNATADALDALPAFQDGFNATPQVKGVRYLLEAWGESFVDPTTKQRIPQFKANKKYAIVHEGMGFQFFTPTRDAEIAEVKSMMTPDGLFVTLEKLKNQDYKARDVLKDEYKAQFFSQKQIDDKAATVLNKSDENAVGMSDYQFGRLAYEELLKKHFKNVTQIYSSGNFAGYYATDSDAVMLAALNNTGDTTTKFNEEVTPRHIAGVQSMAAPMSKPYAESAIRDLGKLSLEDEGGDTLNLDGSKYTGGGVAIPVLSKNVDDYRKMTTDDIGKFINPENIEYVAAGGSVLKAGIYKFPNSTKASIDLNIIAPREKLEEGVKIAGELGQESAFNLDTFENIKTGQDGMNPRKPTVDEVREIAQRLSMSAPSRGYIGTITEDNEVVGVKVPDLSKSNHSDYREITNASEGFQGDWRYNATDKTVYWWNMRDVKASKREKVADWLIASGQDVAGHKDVRSSQDTFNRAHGVQAMAAPQPDGELALGKRASASFLRQKNVKRVIDKTAAAHPEAKLDDNTTNTPNRQPSRGGLRAREAGATQPDSRRAGNAAQTAAGGRGAERVAAEEQRSLFMAGPNSDPQRANFVEPGFYSELQRTIADKMPNAMKAIPASTIPGRKSSERTITGKDGKVIKVIKATNEPDRKVAAKGIGEQMKAMLLNADVTPDELKWSGLLTWLNGRDTVTKDEVEQYLRTEGAVRFSTTTMGGSGIEQMSADERYRKAIDAYERWIYDQDADIRGYEITDKEKAAFREWADRKIDENQLIKRVELVDFDEDQFEMYLVNHRSIGKFEEHTIPGGENYREVILSMPDNNFVSRNHYPDEKNYVAHMRLNERTDATGKQGTLIEELQSDRHQAGRKKGYKLAPGEKPTKAYAKEFFGIEDSVWKGLSEDEKQAYVNEIEEGGKHLNSAIADAPFRQSSAWGLHLFKRALRDAVESGKEWIGWTTGDTQNERFSLEKQINALDAWRMDDERKLYNLSVTMKDGKVKRYSGIHESKLAEYVGEEMAAKLIANPDIADKGVHLTGLDLKTGGDGMRGFYDKIMPREIGDYVKQWGGKVEKGAISGNHDASGNSNKEWDESAAKRIVSNGGEIYVTGRTHQETLIDSLESLADYIYENGTPSGYILGDVQPNTPIWRIEITPQMRQSIANEGQALFMAGPRSESPEAASAALEAWLALPATAAELQMLREQALSEETGKRTVGDPARAGLLGSGDKENRERDAIIQFRKNHKAPEKVVDWMEAGQELADSDPEMVADALLDNFYNGVGYDTPEQVFASAIVVSRMFKEARQKGDPALLRKAQALAYADGAARSENARILRSMVDPHRTPEERMNEFFAKLISTPSEFQRIEIEKAPSPLAKEREIAELKAKIEELQKQVGTQTQGPVVEQKKKLEKTMEEVKKRKDRKTLVDEYTEARRKAVAVALKREGLSEEDVFVSPNERLGAQNSDPVQEAIAMHPQEHREAINYIMRGYSHKDIAQMTKLPVNVVATIHQEFRQKSMRSSLSKWVKKGNTLFDTIQNGLKKVFGMSMAAPIPLAQARAQIIAEQEIERQLNVLVPTAQQVNSGKMVAVIVNRKGGQEVTIKVPFSASDFRSSYRVGRAISTSESNAFDKIYEYWISFGLLSGPETHWANVMGNAGMLAVHLFAQKPLEAAINFMVRDPNSATFGEFGEMIKGILPGVRDAFALAALAWDAEADPIGARYMDETIDLKFDATGNLSKVGTMKGPAIQGTKGRVFRVSTRFLLAMDAFFKSITANIEVGARAHRLGKIAQAKGTLSKAKGDLEAFIAQQVATPGSQSWELAIKTSKELAFQGDNWLTLIAGSLTARNQETAISRLTNDIVKASATGDQSEVFNAKFSRYAMMMTGFAMKFIFPFVKTPTNIIRTGARKAGLGAIGLLTLAPYVMSKGVYNLAKGRNFHDNNQSALMVTWLAEQVQAAAMWMYLWSIAEGDDDDNEKPYYIVGSRPYGTAKPGEREATYTKSGGTQVVMVRNDDGTYTPWAYGRYEPFATVLTSVIDTMREIKDANRLNKMNLPGGNWNNIMTNSIASFASQLQDKSFFQGFANVTKAIEKVMNKKSGELATDTIKGFLQGFVPNIVRQPLRNTDPIVRDSKKADAAYLALPMGRFAEPLLDFYGRESEKQGTSVSRLLIREASKPQDNTKAEEMIDRWNLLHPDKKYQPSRISKTDMWIYGPNKERRIITDNKLKTEFERELGQEILRRHNDLASGIEDFPDNFDDRLRNEATKARDQVRKDFLNKSFERQQKLLK